LDLLREAEFYQLKPIIDILNQHLAARDVESSLVGKKITVIRTETEKEHLISNAQSPVVLLEVSSSFFGEEKDALIYKVSLC